MNMKPAVNQDTRKSEGRIPDGQDVRGNRRRKSFNLIADVLIPTD
jgi:hypothetical protein